MNLSPIKRQILQALLLHQEPVKAAQIAKEAGNQTPATQMHLIGLVRMGYAQSPAKGQYVISSEGKKALDLPAITQEKAQTILAKAAEGKGFHFYVGVGQPLNVDANNFEEFCQKTSEVSVESLQFHLERGDFEAWFESLGDNETAKEIATLKTQKLAEEKLRAELKATIEKRYRELKEAAGQNVPSSS
jgi:hypothetical protein